MAAGDAQKGGSSMIQSQRGVIYNSYAISAAATIGGVLFGMAISSLAPFLDTPAYKDFFNNPNSVMSALITAMMPLGAMITALPAGYVADHVGRKWCLEIAAWIWIVGYAVMCSVQNTAQLIIGRFISGIAVGFASSQIPVFIAEISPRKIRGRLVGSFQWAVTWGLMIFFYIGFGCAQIESSSSFRIAWGVAMIPGFLLAFLVFILPESPRYLAAHGQWEKAIYTIAKINANGDRNDPAVQEEVRDIENNIKTEEEAANLSIWGLFKGRNRIKIFIGVTVMIWQQLCGMNVMMYYIVYVFSMAGKGGNANLVASSIQYVLNVVMTIPALLYIDRWGRRPLFFWGMLLMMIWLFAVGGTMQYHGHYAESVQGNPNVNWLVNGTLAQNGIIACSFLFVCTFAPTWGPAAWIYCAEIFPVEYRSKANGICTAFNWAMNFALAMFTPSAFHNIQYKTYYIFATFCAVACLEVFFMFPESKDRSLELMDEIFKDTSGIWRSGIFSSPKPIESGVPDVENMSKLNEKAESLGSSDAPEKAAAAAE